MQYDINDNKQLCLDYIDKGTEQSTNWNWLLAVTEAVYKFAQAPFTI